MMKTKKGDIWKFKDFKSRGFTNNAYFYCKGCIDEEIILVRCIITQDGKMLIDNKIIDYKNYEDDLVQTSLEEFLKEKYNFELHSLVDFSYKKRNGMTESGLIREIDLKNKKLTVEIEDDDTYEYKDVIVKFSDVLIVYPDGLENIGNNFKHI